MINEIVQAIEPLGWIYQEGFIFQLEDKAMDRMSIGLLPSGTDVRTVIHFYKIKKDKE